jgi:hypothetical protein
MQGDSMGQASWGTKRARELGYDWERALQAWPWWARGSGPGMAPETLIRADGWAIRPEGSAAAIWAVYDPEGRPVLVRLLRDTPRADVAEEVDRLHPMAVPRPECGQVWRAEGGYTTMVLAITPEGDAVFGAVMKPEWPPRGCRLIDGPGAP